MANDAVVKDAPKQDAVVKDAPVKDVVVKEPPKQEAPKQEAPKQEAPKQALYTNASAVLNELPVTLVEKITIMAKKKFADQILAGHATDKHLCQFRTDYLFDLIEGQHKQFLKQVKARDEQRCRELYTSLRERGISVADASKASGYNPLT